MVVDNSKRRAVAGALIDFDDENGVPIYAISAFAKVSRSEAEAILASLAIHDETERIIPISSDKWRITDYGRKAYRDERYASKMRKCLGCSEQFESSHAGNRICEKCVAAEYSGSDRASVA